MGLSSWETYVEGHDLSFQTDDLTILALGILGDVPVEPDQPPLVNGVHLRWYPRQDLGFPWRGFYLFRRESRPRRPVCLSPLLGDLRPGSSRGTGLETRLGRLSSPQALVWTDDFAPSGTAEADGRDGLRFDLPPGVEARHVEVKIGFRSAGQQTARKCVDFRKHPLGFGPNPRREEGVDFEIVMDVASHAPGLSSIETRNGPAGLIIGREAWITLPCAASRVDLLLTSLRAVRIEARNGQGEVLMSRELRAGELQAGAVQLEGAGIAQLYLSGESADSALLHEICYECPESAPLAAIEVRALAGKTVVARKTVQGSEGQTVSATLEGDGITAVEIAPGPAALVDLCYLPTKQGVTFGWGEVPGFTYPLCLPVAHPDYPCAGKPTAVEEAEKLAVSRVTYRAPKGWDQGFLTLHDELVLLVQGGPGGGAMASRVHPELSGTPLSPARQEETPKIPGLRPLDLIYLASLHPAMAQMLGLYFTDQSAAAGVSYDYLLLADPTGVLGGSAESALAWLAFTPDPTQIFAVLVPDREATARPSIAPPSEARAYALPGAATRAIDNTLQEAPGNVGLWWELPPDSTEDDPDRLVFYFPKRVFLGTATKPAEEPVAGDYEPLPHLSPVLVSEPDPQVPPLPPNPRSADWPPPPIELHVVDGNLPEGWYSYRVAGQDLFGRRSPLSPSARWYQWDPPPPKPGEPPPQPPWYYQPPAGHRDIHSYAVALLDKIPPPPPLGVEAWALDPLDRWLLQDQPYLKWRKDNGDKLVGLRVRWRWTQMQQVQARDAREFRLYYQPGRWNALLARTVKVTVAALAVESEVELDLADSHPPGTFAKTRLRVGNDDFEIVGSQPGAGLRLRVCNIGAKHDVRPAEGKPCTVAIPEKHSLWVDTSRATSWAKRLAAVPYDPPARTVVDAVRDGNERLLTNAAFEEANEDGAVTVSGTAVQLPPTANLAGVPPLVEHLELWLQDAGKATETRRVVSYDVDAGTVTLETAPTIGPPVHWILGRPAREYDVFLPAPDVGEGKPFEPSLEQPTVYAQVAVSAADDKKHTKDDPKWPVHPDRYGNEGRLSPSATVFRVLSEPPKAPELPDLGDRLYATRADYHDRSYSTFRFVDPKKPLRVHVLRALDDSLFRRDWLIRETRQALDPVLDPTALGAKTEHLAFFPDGWDYAQRQAAAALVNALAKGAAYSTLSADAWEVLVLLPGNEAQPDRTALEARDRYVRGLRGGLTTSDATLFPPQWTAATRDAAVKKLNSITAPGHYLTLSDSALRLLAALPGNDAAFTQVTLQPLEMADRRIEDQRRPDDDLKYAAKTDRRAYTDTLPGRATNRYFYRALFVDGAQNQSALSLPGPPVYLHKVEPPRTPVITKVRGGEVQIIIDWAPNRDPDLKEYRIYRTDHVDAAGDLRAMALVATLPVSAAERAHPPTTVTWIDKEVTPGQPFFYRITAADDVGNESAASRLVTASAIDTSVPAPPTWVEARWVLLRLGDGAEEPWPADGVVPDGRRPAVRLVWTSALRGATFSVGRRAHGRTAWRPLASEEILSLPGASFLQYDFEAAPVTAHAYRLTLLSASGVSAAQPALIDVPEA